MISLGCQGHICKHNAISPTIVCPKKQGYTYLNWMTRITLSIIAILSSQNHVDEKRASCNLWNSSAKFLWDRSDQKCLNSDSYLWTLEDDVKLQVDFSLAILTNVVRQEIFKGLNLSSHSPFTESMLIFLFFCHSIKTRRWRRENRNIDKESYWNSLETLLWSFPSHDEEAE